MDKPFDEWRVVALPDGSRIVLASRYADGSDLSLYDENHNPVGGRLSLATSLEGRFRVIDGIELALFVDAGTIRDTNTDPVTPDTRVSFGSGLRYLTPIGPVSIVYARKVSPEPEESPYEWHFSLGYTF